MCNNTKNKQGSCHSKENEVQICSLPKVHERDLSHISNGNRLRLISLISKMWVNGTDLTYFFFKDLARRGDSEQEQAVRDAFNTWKQVGIGLTFREVDNAADAIIKISFDHNDGSWSYVGRDCIQHAADPSKPTTNFGWDLTTSYGKDTALHELGHVLGFPHEHQNPRAGIVWDEEKIYASFGGPPNNWSREEIHWNIIRKIPENTVDGSSWDKNSIMHYQFKAGLIKEPSEFQTIPLIPSEGLSSVDKETVKRFYPPQYSNLPELRAFESQKFTIAAGEQIDYIIKPSVSRKYIVQTFGEIDTIMVLFEVRNGIQEFIAGDDDSGHDYNAKITIRLHRNREYIIRSRLYYSTSQGNASIMVY